MRRLFQHFINENPIFAVFKFPFDVGCWFSGTPAEILPLVEAVPKKRSESSLKENGRFAQRQRKLDFQDQNT